MSARLARSLTGGRVKINSVLDPLMSIHRKFHPKADAELLNAAYNTAERLHEGVFRKSGEPYITHPLAVATIAAEIGVRIPLVRDGVDRYLTRLIHQRLATYGHPEFVSDGADYARA